MLQQVSKEFGMNFHHGKQDEIAPGTDIFMQNTSNIYPGDLPSFKGTHMIRDPRDIIISGMHYHKKGTEKWLNIPRKEFGGKSYYEKINELDNTNAIIFEMHNTSRKVIKKMMSWDYNHPDFLELKYEEVITNQEYWFDKIFRHYGFSGDSLNKAISIALENSLTFKKGKPDVKRKSAHIHSGIPRQWEASFNKRLIDEFNQLFGGSLAKLGYDEF
jgi:hypothetical protein